jgi:hypothetical protein
MRQTMDGWSEVTPRTAEVARQNSVAAGCAVRTQRCSLSAGGRVVVAMRLVRMTGGSLSDPTTVATARMGGPDSNKRDANKTLVSREW